MKIAVVNALSLRKYWILHDKLKKYFTIAFLFNFNKYIIQKTL